VINGGGVVGEGFDENRASRRADGLDERRVIGHVDQCGLNPEPREIPGEQGVGAAVGMAIRDDVVAGRAQCEHDGGDRSHAGGESSRLFHSFDRCHAQSAPCD
jgi:hypothetical protein